ncbi:hypothetical protein LPJ59_006033 [Coemansia sp. RSA 2399]|nr:hypothetical protein LPJ59_006033 [Coemansia sp. RSA 2399]KAJ1890266.1 hypothetical protein LPJ81_005968 [Coemansia sp. IMI 209127]
MRMPSWYDIMSLDKIASVEDEAGMNASMMRINELIRNEVDAGIPADRIVVGGFSQGAALSLFTVLQSERKFAGLVVLSGYLPVRDRLVPRITDASKRVPVFQAHGTADEVVLYQYGEMTSEVLKKNGFDAVFKAYQHMDHSTCNDEIRDMQQFLAKQIPEQS